MIFFVGEHICPGSTKELKRVSLQIATIVRKKMSKYKKHVFEAHIADSSRFTIPGEISARGQTFHDGSNNVRSRPVRQQSRLRSDRRVSVYVHGIV